MSEIELQNKRKLNYTCRYISYKNCFVSFLVVTGATDGIGKAYAKEVMYRTFNCLTKPSHLLWGFCHNISIDQ